MKFSRSVWLKVAAVGVSLVAFGFAGTAQARDNIYWSVGVDAAPGVSLGFGNHRPVVIAQPAPIYVQPAPIYVQPRPIYSQPYPVYSQPYPVYSQPQLVYGPRGYVQQVPIHVRPGHGYQGSHHGGNHYDGPPGHWKHRQHQDYQHNRHDRHDRHDRHWQRHGGRD